MVGKAVDIELRWYASRWAKRMLAVVAIGGVLGVVLLITRAHGAAAPRTTWGEPDLMGVWQAAKLGAQPGKDTFNLTQLERLYRPEARTTAGQPSAKNDPALQCVPQSFPRAATFGWPIQIVQRPGTLLIFNEAFHTHRIIPTNNAHVEEDRQFPMYLGDSAGHWDGDTLIVDVFSFNGESWLAGAQDKPTDTSLGVWPTSDALHVVERWRLVDANTLEYQARVEDPKMLTAPWDTPTITFARQPIARVSEAKCLRGDPAKHGYAWGYPDGEPDPATYLNQFGR